MKIPSTPETSQYKLLIGLAGLVLVGVVGYLDYLTGGEISLSLFYLIPIALVAWYAGKPYGLFISISSACAWLLAESSVGRDYAHFSILYWNTFIRFGFFIIVVFLLSALQNALEHEKALSRIDAMTGAVNNRFFSFLLGMEINRTTRYTAPLTIAYVDIDDFKVINDQYGHSTGDMVLRCVTQYCQDNLRKTDTVARLGGDEFALLLPETDQESAAKLITRIRQGLLQEMHQNKWQVTFSIGVLTCVAAVSNADDVIRMADELMYSVKKAGKNAIAFTTCPG